MSSELSPKAQEFILTMKEAVKEIEQINLGVDSLQKRLNQFQKLNDTIDELSKSLKVVDGINQQLKLLTSVTDSLKSVDQKVREAKLLLETNRKSAEGLETKITELNTALQDAEKQYDESQLDIALMSVQGITSRISQLDRQLNPQPKDNDKKQELILEEIKELRNETREILRMLLYKDI